MPSLTASITFPLFTSSGSWVGSPQMAVAATVPRMVSMVAEGAINSTLPVLTGDIFAIAPAFGDVVGDMVAFFGSMSGAQEPVLLPAIAGDFDASESIHSDTVLYQFAGNMNGYSGTPQVVSGTLPAFPSPAESQWDGFEYIMELSGSLPLFESEAFIARWSSAKIMATMPSFDGGMFAGGAITGVIPIFADGLHCDVPQMANLEGGYLPSMSGLCFSGAALDSSLPMGGFTAYGKVPASGEITGLLPCLVGDSMALAEVWAIVMATFPVMSGSLLGQQDELGEMVGCLPQLSGLVSATAPSYGGLDGFLPILAGGAIASPKWDQELKATMPIWYGGMSGAFTADHGPIVGISMADSILQYVRNSVN